MSNFKEGESVFCFDFEGKKHVGTIHKNIEFPNVSEWYVRYEDGSEYAVLDINKVFKQLNDYE